MNEECFEIIARNERAANDDARAHDLHRAPLAPEGEQPLTPEGEQPHGRGVFLRDV